VKLSGAVLVMTGGRGSSSATSVLAELVRTGNGPVAIILEEADAILALGAMVADELYAIALPIVRVQSVSDLPWVDEVVTVWSDVSTGRAGIRQ
jgi:predicted aconitase with swiveling domain